MTQPCPFAGNALRRVATVLKAKAEDAKEELKEEGTFVLVATFRWIRYWRVTALNDITINVPRFRPGYHKLVVMRWDEEAKGTEGPGERGHDDDDEPEEEIAAPPAPAPPAPPSTCGHVPTETNSILDKARMSGKEEL
eukprot:g67120.t1